VELRLAAHCLELRVKGVDERMNGWMVADATTKFAQCTAVYEEYLKIQLIWVNLLCSLVI